MDKIEPILRDNLLLLARAYANHRKRAMTTISGLSHGDPAFLDKLIQRKCSFTARKYDETVARFREIWPEDLAWPALRELSEAKPIDTTQQGLLLTLERTAVPPRRGRRGRQVSNESRR